MTTPQQSAKRAVPVTDWKHMPYTPGAVIREQLYRDEAGDRWIAQIIELEDGRFEARLEGAGHYSHETLPTALRARAWLDRQLARFSKLEEIPMTLATQAGAPDKPIAKAQATPIVLPWKVEGQYATAKLDGGGVVDVHPFTGTAMFEAEVHLPGRPVQKSPTLFSVLEAQQWAVEVVTKAQPAVLSKQEDDTMSKGNTPTVGKPEPTGREGQWLVPVDWPDGKHVNAQIKATRGGEFLYILWDPATNQDFSDSGFDSLDDALAHLTSKANSLRSQKFAATAASQGRLVKAGETFPSDTMSNRELMQNFKAQGLGYHKRVTFPREHGQRWANCAACGAQWSVADTNMGVEFEQVSEGDGYCENNSAKFQASAAGPGRLVKADVVEFRDLRVGERFEFDRSAFPNSGMATGPWVKTSARGYRRESDGMTSTVGSISVKVQRLPEQSAKFAATAAGQGRLVKAGAVQLMPAPQDPVFQYTCASCRERFQSDRRKPYSVVGARSYAHDSYYCAPCARQAWESGKATLVDNPNEEAKVQQAGLRKRMSRADISFTIEWGEWDAGGKEMKGTTTLVPGLEFIIRRENVQGYKFAFYVRDQGELKLMDKSDKADTLKYNPPAFYIERYYPEALEQSAKFEATAAGAGRLVKADDEGGAPNLDSMSVEELRAFANDIGNGVRPIAAARRMFPGRGEGAVNATKSLRNYAMNKLTAMTLRAEGKVEEARKYEEICDRIYNSLPDWARSW